MAVGSHKSVGSWQTAVGSRRSALRRLCSACLLPTAVCLLATGCSSWPHTRGGGPLNPTAKAPSATPTAVELVNYLNDNARRVQSLECRELYLDASQRLQTIGLKGQLVCQKPRNFRMVANVNGSTMVDLGSNNQEFWYWISKAEPPYLFHCSHQDFSQGRARMPFPFQPEWIIEALGVAEYDPNKNYQVVTKGNTFELVETTLSPQGQPLKKVVVFSRTPNQVQVMSHMLLDAAGKEICVAQITEVQQDRASGAVFPRRVQLSWPSEHIKLKMKLDEVAVNGGLDNDRVVRLFSRPLLKDVQTYNLAQGSSVPTGQVRTAGGGR